MVVSSSNLEVGVHYIDAGVGEEATVSVPPNLGGRKGENKIKRGAKGKSGNEKGGKG